MRTMMIEQTLTAQAAEIAKAGHKGRGNTMQDAAAELAALRKDAERYRWLRRNPQWLGWEHDFRPDEVEREIDAAMAVGAA